MRIHIETTATEKAAAELLCLFRRSGGRWVVHACGGEGYVVAKLGTRDGNALLRYGGEESMCGVFDSDSPCEDLADSLAAGRESYTDKNGSDQDFEADDHRGAWRKDKKYVPIHEQTVKVLRDKGPLDAMSVAVELRCSWKTVKSAMKMLRDKGKVVEIGKKPRAEGCYFGAQASVYALTEFAVAA